MAPLPCRYLLLLRQQFALEGISAALGQELVPFGVWVTAVAPGSFRTDWAGRSMRRSARGIADYDEQFTPIRAAREAKSGKQLGDPRKAAQALLQLIALPAPPTHLLLGSDACTWFANAWPRPAGKSTAGKPDPFHRWLKRSPMNPSDPLASRLVTLLGRLAPQEGYNNSALWRMCASCARIAR